LLLRFESKKNGQEPVDINVFQNPANLSNNNYKKVMAIKYCQKFRKNLQSLHQKYSSLGFYAFFRMNDTL